MDHGYGLMFRTGMRRLLWLFAVTFGVVVAFQYFELPYGRVLSSLFPPGNVSFQGKSNFIAVNGSLSNSELMGKTTVSDGLKSTRTFTVHESTNVTMVSDLKKNSDGGNEGEDKGPKNETVSETKGKSLNGSSGFVSEQTSFENHREQSNNSVLGKFGNSENGAAGQEKPGEPKDNISSEIIVTKDSGSFISSSDINTPLMFKNSMETLPKDKNPGPALSNLTVSATSSSPVVNKSSRMPKSEVLSISKMNDLLMQSHFLPHSEAPRWSSPVDQELLYAKAHIQNASSVLNDTGLYAPLYRNVSMFMRSFELMEKMLKVYIYKEGERPIFHDSILDGIYSSEGWFIKLMEANKHFVTEDPQQAHLFYLPFSSRLLQLTLYVPNSHKRSNLVQYMKNYVEMLAATHTFWNRTGGADHFLTACHDWAPAETRGRMTSCLRALCNADIKAGFDIGKDVSLPTTYVRSAKNPLKDIGGESPFKRPILAFFAGYMHGPVRPLLLKHWGNKDSDMKIFRRLPPVRGNKSYIQFMKKSRYCICARGFAVHSPRVVEAIFYECVPVIISDNYVPPFFEVLNWESFAVFILEKDIPDLKRILLSIPEEKYLEMQKRVKMVQQHFLWHAEPMKYDLFHMVLHSIWYNRVFQMRSS